MIACPKCRTIQPAGHVNSGRMEPCPVCGLLLGADIFPAFLRHPERGEAAQSVQEQCQAECFYHPGKQAVVPCDACGRLLCPVCRVEMADRSLCMSCLKTGRDKQKISTLENQRVLYDNIALGLALWPILTVFGIVFTFLSAPAALFFAVRHWRTPATVLPKTWLRSIAAALLACAQMVCWMILLAEWFG